VFPVIQFTVSSSVYPNLYSKLAKGTQQIQKWAYIMFILRLYMGLLPFLNLPFTSIGKKQKIWLKNIIYQTMYDL